MVRMMMMMVIMVVVMMVMMTTSPIRLLSWLPETRMKKELLAKLCKMCSLVAVSADFVWRRTAYWLRTVIKYPFLA